jgi:hypothetical protein
MTEMTQIIIAAPVVCACVGAVVYYLLTKKPRKETLKQYLEERVEPEVPQVPFVQAPLEATMTVPMLNYELSKCMNDGANPTLNPKLVHTKIDHRVWLYNVSRLAHEVSHPILGKLSIPGNSSKKRYVMYTSIPFPLSVPRVDLDTKELYLVPTDARRVVMDVINPDNLGLDQSLDTSKYGTSLGSNDLGKRGVFWSVHNPPKKAEVDAAIARMEKYYKDLLERAEILYEGIVLNAKRVRDYMVKYDSSLEVATIKCRVAEFQATPEMHAAAEWFKVTTPWHPVLS